MGKNCSHLSVPSSKETCPDTVHGLIDGHNCKNSAVALNFNFNKLNEPIDHT